MRSLEPPTDAPAPPDGMPHAEARLSLLHMVSLSLLAGEDTRTIAVRALARLSGVMTGAGRLTFWFFNEAKEFVAQCSVSGGVLQSIEGMRIPMDANPAWLQALQSGETILIEEVATDPRVGAFRASFETAGTLALAVTPITHEAQLLGGISVAAGHARRWLDHEVEILHALADALAIGIVRDRSERLRAAAEAELRRREAHQRIVGAAAVAIAHATPTADVARATLNAILTVVPDVRIACWLARGGAYVPVCSVSGSPQAYVPRSPFATGRLPELLSHGRTVVFESDLWPGLEPAYVHALHAMGTRSLVLVPMIKGETGFGAVSMSSSEPRTWSTHDVSLLEEVAATLAIGFRRERADAARRMAEVEAERNRQFLEVVLNALSFPLYVKDMEHRWILVNEATCRDLGRTRAELIGATDVEVLGTDIAARAWAEEAEAVATGHPVVSEIETEHSSERRWKLRHKVAVRVGEDTLLVGSLVDIDDLKRAEEALQRHQEALERIVEERTAELSRSRDAAESANRAKSEFLANMSHELRTPMHAILSFARLGMARLTGRDDAESEKLGRYYAAIVTSGERLLDLLNNLLDLSKLEAGHMRYDMASVDLREVARSIVDELEPIADRSDVHLEIVAGTTHEAWCDGTRVGQVIRNLVSNAIRFSAPGGRVRIEIGADTEASDTEGQADDSHVRVAVVDEGPGIPEDELEAVFDKFVQGSKTKSGAGGTGLGLAICREIVEQHRGAIRARNNPAAGASFIFRLPRTALPAESA